MKKSILIIDDSGSNADQYGEILNEIGYSYECICSPQQAKDLKDVHSRFSHVFVDFEFGEGKLNGEDVGHLLRSKWELMPLILVSGFIGVIDAAEKYARVGWDALISKKTIQDTGYVDKLFTQKLAEAILNAESRLLKNYPVNEEQIQVIFNRLNALEKAFIANGGIQSKTKKCSDKEALQAACIFLSKPDQNTLTHEDIANLKIYRGNLPKSEHKKFWKEQNVEMTTPNAWYLYFQAREKVPTGEVGKLAIKGMCARHVLLNDPDMWPTARKRFKHLSDLIKAYGLSE